MSNHLIPFTSKLPHILGPEQVTKQPALPCLPLPKSPPTTTTTKQPTKRNLTIEQMREQNLCFKCHDKFFPGHICKPKPLNAMEGEEFCDSEDKIPEPEMEGEIEAQEVEVSINVLLGHNKPHLQLNW